MNAMDIFSDPKKNLKQFCLEEGMRVADFGSGSGYYTLAAAEAVGDTGRVYAIEIQQELLKKVKNLSPEMFKGEVMRIAKNYRMYASWFEVESH